MSQIKFPIHKKISILTFARHNNILTLLQLETIKLHRLFQIVKNFLGSFSRQKNGIHYNKLLKNFTLSIKSFGVHVHTETYTYQHICTFVYYVKQLILVETKIKKKVRSQI